MAIKKQEAAESLLVAYQNHRFLESGDARMLRILSEYLEPQARLRRLGVHHTVVFFGSARIRPRDSFKLVVLAGGSFEPYDKDVERLGLQDRVIVREKVNEIEDYLQAADLGFFTSESESFCLSILEAMAFGCPSVARRAGGIPEVVEDGVSGILVPADNSGELSKAIESLIQEPKRRLGMGLAAQRRAREKFSADVIVPRYEALYRRVCG